MKEKNRQKGVEKRKHTRVRAEKGTGKGEDK